MATLNVDMIRRMKPVSVALPALKVGVLMLPIGKADAMLWLHLATMHTSHAPAFQGFC